MKNLKSHKHIWSVVCSNTVLDQTSNNISLFNTLEKLTITIPEQESERIKKEKVEGFIFPFTFEVVSRFIKEVDSATAFDYKINIINPAGKSVVNSERRIAVDKNIKNLRVRTNFTSIPVSTPGNYIITVASKGVDEARFEQVAELPLEIVIDTLKEKVIKK